MKPYVIYRLDTGDITETGYCPDDKLATLPTEGHAVLVGSGDRSSNYVDVVTQTVKRRGSNPCTPGLTAGKVGHESILKLVPTACKVVVLAPGGATVANPPVEPDGTARFVPQEPGRHAWIVTGGGTFPVRWFLDVAP